MIEEQVPYPQQPMNLWIDFRELRSKLRFEDVLRLYRVELNRKGDQLVGPCPLPNHPKDDRSASFSANSERGIFQCFRCKARGNLLDFAGLMEGIDPRNGGELRNVAAKLVRELCPEEKPLVSKVLKPASERLPPREVEKKVLVNEPLDFELKGLDTKHPWLLQSGLTPETIAYFGIGVAQRGFLKGRLAIPLHDLEGRLVGYAGRILDETAISPENPKYLFPETRERNGVIHRFDPTVLVYNVHREMDPVKPLVVAAEPELVWRKHQEGAQATIGLFGPDCSATQVRMILSLSKKVGRIAYSSTIPPSGNFWREVGRQRAIQWIG